MKQQITKEFDQLKQIQDTLHIIGTDVDRNQYKNQHNIGQASRPGDPSAFFRNQHEDLYLHDPDVWGPPPAKDTRNTRLNTANRKSEVNRRNTVTKSAAGPSTATVAPTKRIRPINNGRASTAKAGSSKINHNGRDAQHNGDSKGEKSDREKDDDNEEEKSPERKFEPTTHADVELVDMLGKTILLLSSTYII